MRVPEFEDHVARRVGAATWTAEYDITQIEVDRFARLNVEEGAGLHESVWIVDGIQATWTSIGGVDPVEHIIPSLKIARILRYCNFAECVRKARYFGASYEACQDSGAGRSGSGNFERNSPPVPEAAGRLPSHTDACGRPSYGDDPIGAGAEILGVASRCLDLDGGGRRRPRSERIGSGTGIGRAGRRRRDVDRARSRRGDIAAPRARSHRVTAAASQIQVDICSGRHRGSRGIRRLAYAAVARRGSLVCGRNKDRGTERGPGARGVRWRHGVGCLGGSRDGNGWCLNVTGVGPCIDNRGIVARCTKGRQRD